jgi:PAS domain S-box-containing protein
MTHPAPHGSHDLFLVGLSILVAVIASYVALDFAAQARDPAQRSRRAWTAAALAMGGGIWSMHFVGMLGFRAPNGEPTYDLGLTGLSLILAVVGTATAFRVIGRSQGPAALVGSGTLMGASVAAMHYTGMAALSGPFAVAYDPSLVALSVLIAIAASVTALWLLVRQGGTAARLGSAVAMGAAVAGMHYTGMAALALKPLPSIAAAPPPDGIGQMHLAIAVATATSLMLLLTLGASLVERRRADALRRSEAQARTASNLLNLTLESMDQGLITVDGRGILQVCNRRAVEMLDLPPDYQHGKPSFAAFIAHQVAIGEFAGLSEEETPWLKLKGNLLSAPPRYERTRPNGTVLEIRTTPLPDGGAVRTFTDITARKQAEEALRQSEERARDFANTASDWFWETDAEFRYTSIVGTLHDGALGKTVWEAQDADPAASPWSELAVLLQARKPFRDFEYDVRTARGRTAWVSSNGHPVFDRKGTFVGYRGASRSITHRKRSEAERESLREQLLQAQKMQAASTLSAGVAHDFNNLLVVVLGNAEILAEECSDPRHRALASMIQEAADRGSDLTQKLLAFGRRQSLKPERVSIVQTVRGMSSLLARTLGEHIDYRIELKGETHLALTDRALLESAILNLVVNARDAMPKGGTLLIRTGEREAGPGEGPLPIGQPVSVVTVSDTGTGMSPDVMARAFDPFYTTKEVGKGSGLGLSMVYGFARQSGGHVAIASREGQGTSVTIVLPAVTPLGLPEADAGTHGPSRAAPLWRILVVEDDPEVRRYATATLMTLGHAVVEVPDAESALAALRRDAGIDLLFTDLVLPKGIDGLELARRARALYPGLEVVFASGDAEDAARRHGPIDPGMVLLQKPYRRTELVEALQRKLQAHPGDRPSARVPEPEPAAARA